MNSKREKLLQKINPKLLNKTPKLSLGSDSFIQLDSGNDTLHEGAKELMLRFFNKHESVFTNKSTVDKVDLSDSKYQDSYRFCQSISKRLSLPFAEEEEFKLERPGKKLQDLKRKLEEKMSIKRKEEYHKRVEEYKKWKKEIKDKKKKLEGSDLSDDEYSDKEAEKADCHNEKHNITETAKEENEVKLEDRREHDSGNNNLSINVNGVNDNIIDNENDDDGDGDDDCNSVSDDGNEGDYDDDSDDGDGQNDDDVIDIRSGEHLEVEEIENGKKEINHMNKSNIGWHANLTHNENTSELNKEVNKSSNEDEEDNDDKYSLLPPYQLGGGLSCSIVDQTQSSQDILPNLLSPSLNLVLMTESQSPKGKNISPEGSRLNETSSFPFKSRNKLFSSIQDLSQQFDLNDALEFCSGKFPTEASSQKSPLNRRQLINSVREESPTTNSSKYKTRIISFDEDSDDETVNKVDDADEGDEGKHMQITSDDEDSGSQVRAMKRGPRQILNFSDEEDDSDEGEPFNHVSINEKSDDDDDDSDNDKKGDSEIEEDEDQRSVYYDSEENEITNPKDFFEKEAELSGSEFSVDEDEKGLDEFDEEAGDADVLDLNEVHSQLGKIHLRRLLDDDSRNVRFLQELFFEDGDLHTDKEYKKFKWKNLAQLKEEQSMEGGDGSTNEVNGESSDEEGAEDIETRKERLKRQLLLQNAQNANELTFGCGLFKNVLRKLKVTTVKSELKVDGENLGDLTGPSATPPNVVSRNTGRGSFLKRNEELLSKLAKTVTSVDNVRGPKNSKNFVFATRSPDKETAEIKRPRQESESLHHKKRRKLVSETFAPSILDLLE